MTLVRLLAKQAAGLIVAVPAALFFMLAIGIAHGSWTASIPTIGYGPAFLIVWLLQGVFDSPITLMVSDKLFERYYF